jgi:hypothetical protein
VQKFVAVSNSTAQERFTVNRINRQLLLFQTISLLIGGAEAQQSYFPAAGGSPALTASAWRTATVSTKIGRRG